MGLLGLSVMFAGCGRDVCVCFVLSGWFGWFGFVCCDLCVGLCVLTFC